MKFANAFRCVLTLSFGLVFAICPAVGGTPDSWQGKVDGLVKPLIEQETIFGSVVGLVTADGKREFYCFGKTKAEGPEPTPETLFEIGSVSKTFTTLLLALMVESGEVKLDDPVRLLLPTEWTMPKRGAREVTLLELATHSSGLPENPPNLVRALIKDNSVQLDPFANFDRKQLTDCLAEIKLKDVDKPPVAYSNLGMGLLGEALMLKTGKSYDLLIRSQVSEPLNMKDTVVIPSKDQDMRTATGHGDKGKELPCWTFASLAGAGAIRSTATDMLTYLEAQSGRTATPLASAMVATQEKRKSAFVIMSVGLGWFIRDYGEHQVWWHNGGTNGFTTFVAFCRKPAVAVVVLCNTGPDGLKDGQVIDKLGENLIRQLVETESKPKE